MHSEKSLYELVYELSMLINDKNPIDYRRIDRKIELWTKLYDDSKISEMVIRVLLQNEIDILRSSDRYD